MTEESVTREAQFLPQNFSFKGNNSNEQITAEFLLSNQNNESKIEQPKLNQNFPIILTLLLGKERNGYEMGEDNKMKNEILRRKGD